MSRAPARLSGRDHSSGDSSAQLSNQSAFFCATPYQIIVAVTILNSLGRDVQADIYVLNHFDSARDVVRRLEKLGLFRRSVLVDSRGLLLSLEKSRPMAWNRSRLLRQMQYALCFLDYRRITRRYCDLDDSRYSDVYFSFPDLIIQLATKVLFNRNRHLKVHLFEDGVGGYNTDISQATRKKRLFNILTGYGGVVDAYSDLLVFQPDLVSERLNLPVLGLPPPAGRNDIVQHLGELFQYRAVAPVKERFIFFEQPLKLVPGLDDKISSIVIGALPRGDTLVKLHPRSTRRAYGDLPVYADTGVPWEIVAMNMSQEDKVLVTFSSTAAVTAKTIADEEPIVIFLGNISELGKDFPGSEAFGNFVDRFRRSYSDPSRVHAPRSVREFRRVIKDVDGNASSAILIDS